MDDQDLYVEFLDGNQKAFEDIMDRYFEKLIYFIFCFVKDPEVAEDLAQDVLFKKTKKKSRIQRRIFISRRFNRRCRRSSI